ncbi:hypothetical protein Hdeb2414_s0013g00404451 [Helianthus debilis subsp. tardiflorus]
MGGCGKLATARRSFQLKLVRSNLEDSIYISMLFYSELLPLQHAVIFLSAPLNLSHRCL